MAGESRLEEPRIGPPKNCHTISGCRREQPRTAAIKRLAAAMTAEGRGNAESEQKATKVTKSPPIGACSTCPGSAVGTGNIFLQRITADDSGIQRIAAVRPGEVRGERSEVDRTSSTGMHIFQWIKKERRLAQINADLRRLTQMRRWEYSGQVIAAEN